MFSNYGVIFNLIEIILKEIGRYTKDDKWFIKDWSYPTGRQYVGDL